jgi:hypothetical protein
MPSAPTLSPRFRGPNAASVFVLGGLIVPRRQTLLRFTPLIASGSIVGGHHAGEAGKAVREVLGAAGRGKATMPADDKGAVAGDDLAKILAWASAFDRAQAASEAGAPNKDGHHAH